MGYVATVTIGHGTNYILLLNNDGDSVHSQNIMVIQDRQHLINKQTKQRVFSELGKLKKGGSSTNLSSSAAANLFVRLLRLRLHSVKWKVLVEAVVQVTGGVPRIAAIGAAFVHVVVYIVQIKKERRTLMKSGAKLCLY